MNIRQLQYFIEVAEMRSFTRASKVLNVAQPALSRQIRLLEEEIGSPLFNRVDRGVTLTETGEALRDRAIVLLYQFDQLRNEVVTPQNPHGDFTIGMPPAMRDMITVPLVDAYCGRYQHVSLHIHEGISIDLGRLVQVNKVDCAVIVDLEPMPIAKKEPFLREQLFLVGSRQARLDVSEPVSFSRAASKPLILTNRLNNFRVVLEGVFARERLPLKIIADSNSTGMMVELVARGLAHSILPYCAIAGAMRIRKISAAPIKDLSIDWAIVHPIHSNPSAAGNKFKSLLMEIAREKINSGEWVGAKLTA
jgi:LysR family nitrogen assimilation transcriptional regulator